ncbi:MAG: 30S ribosomal protein S19e [Methanobacteriaceae archaeon]
MSTVYDVPADLLINQVAKDLSEKDNINAPEWSILVKTGVHKERKPENVDWWYVRCATLLRRVYIDGPVGINSLRTFYGGKKDRGFKPEKFKKGSGAIIRGALHQLEAEGLIAKEDTGRVITPAGRSFLDKTSQSLIKDIKGLEKY